MGFRSRLLAAVSASSFLLACAAPYGAADEDPECDPATEGCVASPKAPATSSNGPTTQGPTTQDKVPTEPLPVPPPPPPSPTKDAGARDASADG